MKVAIIQNRFIQGGRLRLVASLVAFLNSKDITPEIISYDMDFDAKFILQSFGIKTDFTVRLLSRPPKKVSQEMDIIFFHLQMRKIIPQYTCVINSSNSWIGIAHLSNVIHYIHFPRKYRLWKDIHNPTSEQQEKSLLESAHGKVMRFIYDKYDSTAPSHIAANSHFTESAIQDTWQSANPDVIYPPITQEFRVPNFQNWQSREAGSFVILGRFSPVKRQLKLIEQVSKFDAQFHFIGFADRNSSYYLECERLASIQGNIFLHPNATSDEMENILQSSRYYIHTTVNEPFGLSITDAVSQGLLPIVHRSGGAIEIVTATSLQYDDLARITDTLNALEGMELAKQHAVLTQLSAHCNEAFGLASFEQGWKEQLSKLHIIL